MGKNSKKNKGEPKQSAVDHAQAHGSGGRSKGTAVKELVRQAKLMCKETRNANKNAFKDAKKPEDVTLYLDNQESYFHNLAGLINLKV